MTQKRFWSIYVPAAFGYVVVERLLNAVGMGGLAVLGFFFLVDIGWYSYTGKLPRIVETPHPSADFQLEDEYQRLLDKNRTDGRTSKD
jgi:hypothetical protein